MNHNIISTDQAHKNTSHSGIRVGLSACLAGHEVRYNGGHVQSRLCLNVLNKYFTFHTFCPEIAAGFSTPRTAMRLTGNPQSPTLSYSNGSPDDLTAQLTEGFKDKLKEFEALDGYILMKNSPSCGLERVKVYQPNGHPHQVRSSGLFTQKLKEAYPLMPIEEEGRLHDDRLLDNFLLRVYAHNNFRTEVMQNPSLHALIQFHSRYKYTLMSHGQQECRQLGKLLSNESTQPLTELIQTYFQFFMNTLSILATRKNHTNSLLHILGYLKKHLPPKARQDIAHVVNQYQKGIIPLTTPLTLLSHYLSQYGSSYINNQRYLKPYPNEIHPISKHCI